jgi:hypothetical protein
MQARKRSPQPAHLRQQFLTRFARQHPMRKLQRFLGMIKRVLQEVGQTLLAEKPLDGAASRSRAARACVRDHLEAIRSTPFDRAQ